MMDEVRMFTRAGRAKWAVAVTIQSHWLVSWAALLIPVNCILAAGNICGLQLSPKLSLTRQISVPALGIAVFAKLPLTSGTDSYLRTSRHMGTEN